MDINKAFDFNQNIRLLHSLSASVKQQI